MKSCTILISVFYKETSEEKLYLYWFYIYGFNMVIVSAIFALLSADAVSAGSQPDEVVLDALEGTTLLRTDQHGWIKMTTDGEKMWGRWRGSS